MCPRWSMAVSTDFVLSKNASITSPGTLLSIVECGRWRLYRYSMKWITALRASSRVRHLLRLYMLFLRVAKNDSATALSWHDPVRPTDSLASCSSAHLANNLLVYWDPRMPF